MASADALMRTRFICACSRVKPTTETKNSASNVIRFTLKSPAEAQSARGLIEPDQSYTLGFGVRWTTPGRLIARAFFLGGEVCERRLGGEAAHFRAGRCRRSQTWVEHAFSRSPLPFKSEPQERGRAPTELPYRSSNQ